ncbi:MAG TPA: hypothetical protein VF941_05765 [Clostridia bacterium]
MSSFNHTYRVIKSSWGIVIDVSGELTSISTYDNKSSCKMINSGLWCIITDERLSETEKKYLYDGLEMVGKAIASNSSYKNETLIIINSVTYSFCDYQEEGLTAAIIQWAANAFNFEAPKINVAFNKEHNKYEFNYLKL